MKNKFYL